jgi:hypothetical protein
MNNDTFEILVPGPKCSGPKLFRAEVYTPPKYSLGQSIHRAEVFSGPKLFPGQSCFGLKYFRAEVSVGPKLSLGQTGCEPFHVPLMRTAVITNITFKWLFSFMNGCNISQ